MDANAAAEIFRKYQKVIEDLWIEKQVCFNLIVDRNILTKAELDRGLEEAKRSQEYRRTAAETFAGTRKELAEMGIDAMLEGLPSMPPASDK